MRIRIIRAAQGDIDGVPLDTFAPGVTYDVSTELATYLIATASAEAVVDDVVADGGEREQSTRHAVNVQRWREIAADYERLPRKRRR